MLFFARHRAYIWICTVRGSHFFIFVQTSDTEFFHYLLHLISYTIFPHFVMIDTISFNIVFFIVSSFFKLYYLNNTIIFFLMVRGTKIWRWEWYYFECFLKFINSYKLFSLGGWHIPLKSGHIVKCLSDHPSSIHPWNCRYLWVLSIIIDMTTWVMCMSCLCIRSWHACFLSINYIILIIYWW